METSVKIKNGQNTYASAEMKSLINDCSAMIYNYADKNNNSIENTVNLLHNNSDCGIIIHKKERL